MDRTIQLIGGISDYGVCHDYVKYLLDQLGEGPVTVKCSSIGGDVNQALLIKALFEDRGDVTVEYVGFNASAATIIGHGALKTCIREDAMYLIHKPMILVYEWGRMNEDEITEAIQELEQQKKDAEKITLMIAQDYVNSRGMEIGKVLELMTDARWLTAKEAVDLGLVDELIPAKTKNAVVTNEVLAMMTANGYPVPTTVDETEKPKGILNSIIDKFSKTTTMTLNKEFAFVNAVLSVEGVDMAKDGKVTLSVEQMSALNAKLESRKLASTTLAAKLQSATNEKTVAENALSNVMAQLDAISPDVKEAADAAAKVTAINAILSKRPGEAPEKPQGQSGANETPEADFDTIDALPHNVAADKTIY